MASKCVVEIDALLFVFILATLTLPALWLLGSDTNFAAAQSAVPCGPAEGWANLGSDPKNQRELTAIFGRVFEGRKYTRQGTLRADD